MTEKITYPTCEVCGKHPATSFSFFLNRDDAERPSGQWKFACDCTSDTEFYYVLFDGAVGFFSSPKEKANWLSHLKIKIWMDWQDFNGMMCRFENIKAAIAA